MDSKHTGAQIRRLREKKAWTQEHLAKVAGISPRTVQRAEEGAMSAETKKAIAGAFDVAVESLAPVDRPEGWPQIVPSLVYDDSRAAVPWLQKAFGFEARNQMSGPGGQIIHAELTLGEGLVMVGHSEMPPGEEMASPKTLGKGTQAVFAYVIDVEAHFARAKEAGARIASGIESSYGMRRYRAYDLEWHLWTFATYDAR